MAVSKPELQTLISNISGANGNGNVQREINETQNNNGANGNGSGQRESSGNQNNGANGNGSGQRESSGNQNCRAAKGCVPKELSYVSFVVNGIFLGLVSCFLVLYLVGGNDDYKDDLPSSRSVHPPPEDSFYSCLPCEPMDRTDDADTMRLFMKSSSLVCCKRISPVVKIEIPITSQISEKCQSNKTSKEGTVGALLYINHNRTFHTSGLHWMLGSTNTYIKGGVGYEELHRYGRLIVPSDGVYAVYSYIQFDSYTVHVNSTLDHPKPEMHVLYKNGNHLIQLNKFMLRQHSYITSHVGPILVELKARDSIHAAVGSMGRFIHNNPQSSVFGLYKL